MDREAKVNAAAVAGDPKASKAPPLRVSMGNTRTPRTLTLQRVWFRRTKLVSVRMCECVRVCACVCKLAYVVAQRSWDVLPGAHSQLELQLARITTCGLLTCVAVPSCVTSRSPL